MSPKTEMICMCVGSKDAPAFPSLVQSDEFQHRAPVQTPQTDSVVIHYSKQLCNSLIFSFTNWLIPHTINLPMPFEGIWPNRTHSRAPRIYSLVAICCYGNSGNSQTKHGAQKYFFFFLSFSLCFSFLISRCCSSVSISVSDSWGSAESEVECTKLGANTTKAWFSWKRPRRRRTVQVRFPADARLM